MSKTFMRGLGLLELIDLYGPLTVTELARRSGTDKSIVSRMISSCEPDGWVVRSDGKLSLGPRAALLGHSSPAAATIRQAEPLVHAVAGVTGLLTQVYGLVGTSAVVLASASGRGPSVPTGLGIDIPLYATAGGKAVAAQLEDAELDQVLPPDPFPDAATELLSLAGYPQASTAMFATPKEPLSASAAIAQDRRQLAAQLDAVRLEGYAVDAGDFHPDLGCIAKPWPHPGIPTALACMGPPSELASGETLIKAALTAATSAGAKPEDIISSAAGAIRDSAE